VSKYSEILGEPKAAKAAKPEMHQIEGSFECHVCRELVDDARYYPTESLLVWECSEKHKSHIEGFDLM
jgi:hypothetical protein